MFMFIKQIAIKHEYINEMVSSDVPPLHSMLSQNLLKGCAQEKSLP